MSNLNKKSKKIPKPRPRPEVKSSSTPVPKPRPRPEVKASSTPEVKASSTPEVKSSSTPVPKSRPRKLSSSVPLPPSILSYANTVRRGTSLKIAEIPIIQWLKHYGLEDYHDTIFVEKHIVYTSNAPPNNKYPYEYSDLLTTIKTNVDLLFSFQDSIKFFEAISLLTERKLFEMVIHGLITQEQMHDHIVHNKERFLKAFELLLSQKLEYKAMLSIFGVKPSKSKYDSVIETNLDFLEQENYKSKHIFKDEIIAKLKLISFDDLLQCKQTTFNLLLSLPIEEIKKYILYTTNKLVKITKGLKPSFTKKQFNSFIDKNESLKVFESCYNNYDLRYVTKSFKTNFDAKTLLSTHRMDLLEYIFNPNERIETEVSEQIYATLFPDNDHIYIEEQFSRIGKSIPKTPITDEFMIKHNKKMRVFFIQGHGATCTIEDYKKRNRVNFEKVFTKIHNSQARKSIYQTKYNANMFNVISTQPVGRKSLFDIIQLFNKILSSKYRNTFLQGLINATNIEHLRGLENIVNMYLNYYSIKNIFHWQQKETETNEKLSPYLKKSKLKHYKSPNNVIKYSKTNVTTSDIVNFVKYGFNYSPINTQFYFDTYSDNEGLLGIFELNEDNASDFIKLENKIISIKKKDNKLKLGLKLNEVYEFRGDIPDRTDEILKYNKALQVKASKIYTMEELIEHIYLVGDIKKDEYVIIFDNSCRGIMPAATASTSVSTKAAKRLTLGNTRDSMPLMGKHRINRLRLKSIENSLGIELEGGTRDNRKTNKKI